MVTDISILEKELESLTPDIKALKKGFELSSEESLNYIKSLDETEIFPTKTLKVLTPLKKRE